MKLTLATLAALAAGASAAKTSRTFAVMHFNGKEICNTRADPIVNPGVASSHAHTVFGGSNFGMDATGEILAQSSCTSTKLKSDKSNYWVPKLYFHDAESGAFEEVPMFYANAYYFFEATDDDIKAFPLGLQMVSGDASKRTVVPAEAKGNQDPNDGPVNPAMFTCPRKNDNTPAWPAGSDGSMAGIVNPNNKGEGVGFPVVTCDGYASPLRMDVHFPSCYNPQAGLTNYRENMAWPTHKGASGGRANCPPGYIHVPHLFLEVYWDTLKFQGRWQENAGHQPFVLSNGDITGYSSHADFLSGWDEKVLQNIIDHCDAGHAGMESCPGIAPSDVNKDSCTCQGRLIDEKVTGTLTSLPGNNPLSGFQYGSSAPTMPNMPAPPPPPPAAGSSSSSTAPAPAATSSAAAEVPTAPEEPEVPEKAAPSETPAPQVPEDSDDDVPPPAQVPNGSDDDEAPSAPAPTLPATTPAPAPISDDDSVDCGAPPVTSTIWKTITVTAADEEPTQAPVPESGAIEGYTYAGCYKDASNRVLKGKGFPNLGPMSNEKCVSYCKKEGFSLAGTEYAGECFCGNELVGSQKIDEAQCKMECKGAPGTKCGGDWALTVYSVDGTATVKARRHLRSHARRAI